MTTIGIVGYFGYNNLGDEWFIRTWKQLFEPEIQVHVVHPWESLDALDAIIIGGGDLILPGHLNNHYFWDALYEKPYWIYGVGVVDQPWINLELAQTYREVLANAQGVYLRDHLSQEDVITHNICPHAQAVEDICWAGPLPMPWLREALIPPRWLGFSVRPGSMYNQDDFVVFLAQMAGQGYHLLAIPLQPSDHPGLSDYDEHVQIVTRINAEVGIFAQVVPPDMTLEKRMAMIGSCTAYVSTRMHGLIAGLRYRIPTVGLVRAQTRKFRALTEKVAPDLTVTSADQLPTTLIPRLPTVHRVRIETLEIETTRQLQRFRNEVRRALGLSELYP